MSMKPLSKAGWRDGKLMTLEELEQIANERRAAKEKSPRALNVCVAAGCLSLHSDAIKSALEKEVQRTGANCRVAGTGCLGLCSQGPLVSGEPDGCLLKNVAESDAAEIVARLDSACRASALLSRATFLPTANRHRAGKLGPN